MSLMVHFEADELALVEQFGPNRFRLYASGGRYGLPNIWLRTTPDIPTVVLQSVRLIHTDVSGELDQWLRTSWVRDSRPVWEVSSRACIADGVSLLEAVVDRSLPQGLGTVSRGVVRVAWVLAFDDPVGGPGEGHVECYLDFAPADAVRSSAPGASREETNGAVPTLRHRSDEDSLKTFAAIDFGTSSSTVTLHDSRKVPPYHVDPEQAAQLSAALAAVLRDAPPEPEIAAQWRAGLARLETGARKRLHPVPVTSIDDVAVALRQQPPKLELMHTVCLELDRLMARASPEVAQWLAPRLHQAYDLSFRTPPVPTLSLRPLPFGDRHDISSTVWVTATSLDPDPMNPEPHVELGEVASRSTGACAIHDLKRRFGRPGSEHDILPEIGEFGTDHGDRANVVDHLVAAAYDFLAVRTELYARRDRDSPLERLNQLVVTYPTTTTPSTRRRLEKLIEHGLDIPKVTMSFDEGVAAGLYFLMRDLGGDQALGAEALRADSRPVPDEPGRWRQTMLVIDIGGGTTDIALIGLTLSDLTPEDLPDVADAAKGRYYLIEPEIIGSTGHPLLGGDYLTLRLFYWLKAAIVDALASGGATADDRQKVIKLLPPELRSDPTTPGSLADIVIAESTAEHPAPRRETELLGGLLVTRWSNDDPETEKNAFRSFWAVAERAKITLGGGEVFQLSKTEIEDLLMTITKNRTQVPWDDNAQLVDNIVPENGLTLTVDDFTRLMRPAVQLAADYATDLVTKVLRKHPGERLDQVFLSGQTSKMKLVADEVSAQLARARVTGKDGASSPVELPPIEVETKFGKQAASLGACWAQNLTEFGDPNPDNPLVRQGRTVVKISVDNLRAALPCDFFRNVGGGQRALLFPLGKPFEELDPTGVKGVRSEWHTVTPTHEVQRELGKDDAIRWSYFAFGEYARETGASYNRRVWEGQAATMMVQVELDQECTPTLHLCNRGEPRYVAYGVPHDLSGPLAEFIDEEGLLAQLPEIIVVTGRGGARDPERRHPVCRAWRPGDTVSPFTVIVHPDDDPDSTAVSGMVCKLPHTSSAHGAYSFRAVVGDREITLGELTVPGEWGSKASYSALLTSNGILRLHRGGLPYLRARNMSEVEKKPGAVLTVPVSGDQTMIKDNWNPFSGKH